MRNLLRNQKRIWYSLYEGKAPVLKDGFETGQYQELYSDPVQVWVSLSSAAGRSETELFGAAIQYDRVLSTVECLPIDEYSRLWVDADPTNGDEHDYKVKRVARGLHQHLWAVEKVVRNGC